jgi:hypothetical protein
VTVRSTVETALRNKPMAPWQRQLAFALAASMDDRPAASTAKELRVLMAEILGEHESAQATKDPVDDITARIAARRAAAGS